MEEGLSEGKGKEREKRKRMGVKGVRGARKRLKWLFARGLNSKDALILLLMMTMMLLLMLLLLVVLPLRRLVIIFVFI